MKREYLTTWQMEILSDEYRKKRSLLEKAITNLNRYLRRVSYEMALKQATPTLLSLLQTQLELTYEDELKIYRKCEEVPADVTFNEILKWWDNLSYAIKNAEPAVPEEMKKELENSIISFNNAYTEFGENY